MSSTEARAKLMGEEKIPKLLIKLSIPAIIGMLVNAVYNVVDTMFVGMLQNTSATAAVSVVFPIFMLIGAVGLTFGMGAASYISRMLGENKKEQADKTASTAFFSSLAVGILFTILGHIFLEPLLRGFGASETVLPFAKSYARVLITCCIFNMLNMTMNNMIRAEGNPKCSMIALSLGAGLNIILDPIFMFVLGMGIKGAAVATALSQCISFIYLISYYLKGKSYVKISKNNISFTKEIYSEIMKIGIPTFLRQLLTSISFALINGAAMPYGDAAVASIGISMRVVSIGYYIIFGYNQGFQPAVGYNYGAKKYNRVFEALKVSQIWTTIFLSVLTIILFTFAEPILYIFSNDPEVIKIGVRTIRAMIVFLPLFGYQIIYNGLFQALGRGREAFILSIARQGIFLIPTIIILPKIFNLDGVLFSQAVADFFTIFVTFIMAINVKRRLNEEMRSWGKIQGPVNTQ